MGVLTDFVVADLNEAQKVGESGAPYKEYNGIDAKGIDQVKMGTLYAILSGTEYDPEFLTSEESFLYTGSEDGPWVQHVPNTLTSLLAKLSADDIPRIAEAWGKTEEFDPSYSGWSLEDINAFLLEISKLALLAIHENKALLMWMCL